LPHFIIAHFSDYQCGHTINNPGTQLLQCPCGSEYIATHDTLWDILAIIALRTEHMFKGRFLTFSFATLDDKWTFLLFKKTLKL
jgi:hypothetical protein